MSTKRKEIHLAIVHKGSMFGRASKITVPNDEEMSLKDIREYILGCASGDKGTESDQNIVKDLISKTGVTIDDISKDAIQARENISGTLMEKDAPNWPILSGMHIIFLHPEPVL